MTKWLALIAISMTAAAFPSRSLSDDMPQVVVRDQARIREHLSAVEAYLREQDTSDLTEAQREARRKNLDRLHDYWVAGVFPRNTLTDYPTPIFIDPAGRACAVAHLMVESGWEEAAQEVAVRENLAYVNDIQSPGVAAWLEQSGLTAQEAAWIQPDYNSCNDECPCDEEPVCGADGITYVNSCFAESCGEQFDYIPGCCAVADRIDWSGDLGFALVCENDPNERTETLCAEAVGPLDPESAPASGCSATRYQDRRPWGAMLLLALALLAVRRHAAARRLL